MEITNKDIETIEKVIKIPTILFSESNIIYLNQASREFDLKLEYLSAKAVDFVNSPEFQCQLVISRRTGGSLYAKMTGEWVVYQDKRYVLAQFFDISDARDLQYKNERLSKARELMLEISQSVTKINEIETVYELILNNVLKIIEKSSLASISKVDGDSFRIVTKSGYTDESLSILVPIKESFLYRATDGKMEKTTYIRDLSIYYDSYQPIKIEDNETAKLLSSLVAPLYMNGQLFGMICVDSSEKNAFSEEDIEMMEFVKNSVEIALSNHWYVEKIDYLANHDAMTGLMNRVGFHSYFQECSFNFQGRKVWFTIFDVNGLKHMNDTYGHLWGDQMITDIAARLEALCGEDGILVRFGGDEFLGVFFENSQKTLKLKIEGVLKQLREQPYLIDGQQECVSFSYGIAQYQKEGTDLHTLIAIADERMYEYKRRYQSMNENWRNSCL